MQDLKKAEMLQELLETYPVLLVQFGSESCMPCQGIRNRVEDWQKGHPQVGGVYISIEMFPELAAQEGVFTVPCLSVYVEGKQTLREAGYFSVNQILSGAERYLTLLDC